MGVHTVIYVSYNSIVCYHGREDSDDEYVYEAPEYNITNDPHMPESESLCYVDPRSNVALP